MKFLIDSTVFFEHGRRRGNPQVKAWFTGLVPGQVYLHSILAAEYMRGVLQLPATRDRMREIRFFLKAWWRFERVLIDHRVASRFAALRHGLPRGVTIADADTWVAALALTHRLTVATRNVRHFEPFAKAGVQVHNPWG